MSVTTRGLRNKQKVITINQKRKCNTCEGDGSINYGAITVHNRGEMTFLRDCEDCNGEGYMSFKVLKRRRKALDVRA